MSAHAKSAYRENPSSTAVFLTGRASGDYAKAMASALLTLGALHAPIEATYSLLASESPEIRALDIMMARSKVPGWGNSFVKGRADEMWCEVNSILMDHPIHKAIDAVQSVMDEKGIYPNPSCYTAASAIALGIPKRSAAWLFVNSRLAVWTRIFSESQR
jgi:citrate synthase